MAGIYGSKRHRDLIDLIWKAISEFKSSLSWLSWLVPYRSEGDSKEKFDAEFASKIWDRLHDIDQLGRYSLLVGYCRYLSAKRILDAGCGQGVLLKHLSVHEFDFYEGIDFSDEAISIARTEFDHLSNAGFSVADINQYKPDKKYDLVVFNECLYYTDDPLATVKRYVPFIEPEGHLIVSLYGDPRNRKIMKFLSKNFHVIDTVTLAHKATGKHWTIIVYKI